MKIILKDTKQLKLDLFIGVLKLNEFNKTSSELNRAVQQVKKSDVVLFLDLEEELCKILNESFRYVKCDQTYYCDDNYCRYLRKN